MPPAATSKPGIVHNPDLVSLYNGCYLYEGQFVYSTCSFNKRKFYKKKKKSKETLLCLALLKGKGGGVPTVGARWEGMEVKSITYLQSLRIVGHQNAQSTQAAY